MKLNLNIAEQRELLEAHGQMDTHEVVTGDKVVRVPFKLGAERRTLVRNLTALKTNLSTWQETMNGIMRECFPNIREGDTIEKKDHPEAFAKYQEALAKAAGKKDEIELLSFSSKVIYEDNEFPALACAILEQHGLIDG